MIIKDDKYYIRRAIELAVAAKAAGDTAFGSLLVDGEGNILMEDQNQQIVDNDITAHSELRLVKRAAQKYDEEFLSKCTIYNSGEPCTMCTGVIFWSGIGRVVYGISKERVNELMESKSGIQYSIHQLLADCGKDIEVVGPMDDMKDEVEAPFK